jgi:integrase
LLRTASVAAEDRWKDKNHAMQWTQTLRDYVYPIIGDVPLGEIGVDHIVRVLEPIWGTKHVTAKKVRSRIRLILDWAEAMEWRSGDNPTRSKAVDIRLGNGMSHAVKHFEAIPYRQMPGFWEALAGNETVKGDATRFMILTAARTNEALGATWEEIDLEQRVWTIPAARMKMERGHRVPLSDQAMAVLEKRRTLVGDELTGLVFPSTKGGQLHRSVPKAVAGYRDPQRLVDPAAAAATRADRRSDAGDDSQRRSLRYGSGRGVPGKTHTGCQAGGVR